MVCAAVTERVLPRPRPRPRRCSQRSAGDDGDRERQRCTEELELVANATGAWLPHLASLGSSPKVDEQSREPEDLEDSKKHQQRR